MNNWKQFFNMFRFLTNMFMRRQWYVRYTVHKKHLPRGGNHETETWMAYEILYIVVGHGMGCWKIWPKFYYRFFQTIVRHRWCKNKSRHMGIVLDLSTGIEFFNPRCHTSWESVLVWRVGWLALSWWITLSDVGGHVPPLPPVFTEKIDLSSSLVQLTNDTPPLPLFIYKLPSLYLISIFFLIKERGRG